MSLLIHAPVTKEEEEEVEKMDVKAMVLSEVVVGLSVCMVVVVTAVNPRHQINPACNLKMSPFPVLVLAQTVAILHAHFTVH